MRTDYNGILTFPGLWNITQRSAFLNANASPHVDDPFGLFTLLKVFFAWRFWRTGFCLGSIGLVTDIEFLLYESP
jgi:hypothetical protein